MAQLTIIEAGHLWLFFCLPNCLILRLDVCLITFHLYILRSILLFLLLSLLLPLWPETLIVLSRPKLTLVLLLTQSLSYSMELPWWWMGILQGGRLRVETKRGLKV
jgi:hypothetical protein